MALRKEFDNWLNDIDMKINKHLDRINELEKQNNDINDKYKQLQHRYTNTLHILNLELLPKIFENKELLDIYCKALGQNV